MSDRTNNYESIEARLAQYGDVLQGHLDGEQASDDSTGTLLVGGFGADMAAPASRRKPTIAVLSAAAAILVAVGLLLPTLAASDPTEPITVTGGDVASAPETGDGSGALANPETGDHAAADSGEGLAAAQGDSQADDKVGSDASESNEDLDWSAFSVAAGGSDDERGERSDGGDPTEDRISGTAAASGAGEDAADKPNEADKPDDTDKPGESSDDQPGDKPDAGEQNVACPEGKEKRDGECVLIGAPPTADPGGCPAGAVVFGQECYQIVPPTCGDLAVAPDGDGCLKLIGAASAQGGCPQNYELEGDTCVKLLAAPVSCSQGTPSGDACLIKETPTGSTAGCAAGQTQFGSGCYELSNPAIDCGGLATLADGTCRLPVEGEQASQCAPGLQPWDNVCYRYEDPPTFDCAGGESDGAGWCLTTEAATPGPDVCDDGVLQDAQGCYVLVSPDGDGSCGGLPEFEGQCRKAKASYQTWACSDGKTVYEPTCNVWVEAASVTCAAGEPVDNNTKCKTIEQPITTDGCPSYALEDSQGCYKSKQPQFGCGDLAKTPDGQQCKTWVGDAESGASCSSGFELVGGYCKKYVDGVPGACSGAESVIVNGSPKCKYTTSPTDGTSGCAAGAVEQSGNCYLVVPASCQDLDTDLYGKGCKQPVETESGLVCEAGYTLVGDECIKKS